MKIEVIKKNNIQTAAVSSDELLITDVQFALDLIMTVQYETGCTNIAINKEKYTSKPLKDFMYESNHGKDIYFQSSVSLAVDKLSGCA